MVIGGHLPNEEGGYVPFLHKLLCDYEAEDIGKVFVGTAFDPVFYSVDSLYFCTAKNQIFGTGAPRDLNFNVISGTHIFFVVSLTSTDFCEAQAFAMEFDVDLKRQGVAFVYR